MQNIDDRRWAVWQLAGDEEEYGDDASCFIIVTEDGEDEIDGPVSSDGRTIFQDESEAQAIVDAHNARLSGTDDAEASVGRPFVHVLKLTKTDYITTLALLGDAWHTGEVATYYTTDWRPLEHMHADAIRAHSHAIDYAVRCASI